MIVLPDGWTTRVQAARLVTGVPEQRRRSRCEEHGGIYTAQFDRDRISFAAVVTRGPLLDAKLVDGEDFVAIALHVASDGAAFLSCCTSTVAIGAPRGH